MGNIDATIRSEELEPTFAYLVGRWFAKCQAAHDRGDRDDLADACAYFWQGIIGLRKVCFACPEARHAGLAVSNHERQVAKMIQDWLGIDPYKEWEKR